MATRLITGIAAGSRGDFTEFYRLTSRRVLGLALRISNNHTTAEEVSQDVYVQVWAQSARYDPRMASPLGWLLMLTHRRAVDRVRADSARLGRDVHYDRLSRERAHDLVVESVFRRADRRAVLRALDMLTDLQRQAVVLAFFDGLTYLEVAEHLGKPLATVKSRIRDGLERLRHHLTRTAVYE
ncbi:sigma-70 family RNA polymerase sigma factor [Nocardia sp. NPDC005978]|uniref:sigma-70 family RNA polymerase sigma factor n=1 Tax=unclassified Nocardia TaxID=2637762 RepID=UPI0033BDF8FD